MNTVRYPELLALLVVLRNFENAATKNYQSFREAVNEKPQSRKADMSYWNDINGFTLQ